MNANNMLDNFQQLSELDADLWAKKPWPSDEDTTCRMLIAELGGFETEEQALLSDRIRELCLDRQLEVFAFRSGKSATRRSDIEDAYRALSLCQSKERLMVESHLVEFAKAIGVNGRKVKRGLST